MTKIEPAGYIDEFGNFEPILLPWMQEEPGVAWEPVYKQAQMRQLAEACAVEFDKREKLYGFYYPHEPAKIIRKLIEEMLP